MTSTMDLLIDHATGDIDTAMVSVASELRAIREFGSPNYPPRVLREATAFCNERAQNMRMAWRQHRGLPYDGELTTFNQPDWGASGDSFRR